MDVLMVIWRMLNLEIVGFEMDKGVKKMKEFL